VTTVASGDDGVDVIVTRSEPYQQKKLIQVKQRNDPLSRRHVQQYSYLHHKRNVDEVLLVTTSGFTDGAYESAKEANVKLIGPGTIISLINEADANHILKRYSASDINLRDKNAKRSTERTGGEQPIPTKKRTRFAELAENEDIYSILTQSIPLGHPVSPAAKLAIVFQLFRGNDPFHVLLITEAGDRATDVLDKALDFTEPSTYVNCSTATVDGLIGKYNSGGRTHRGVFTECANGVVALDKIDQLSGQDVAVEPLEQQRVTATEADHHDEYEANFSCLATSEVKYGTFDEYESLDKQVSLQPAIFESFDAKVWLNTDRGEIRLPPGFTELDSPEIETLGINDLTAYVDHSIRIVSNPQMTDNAQQKAKEIIEEWKEYDDITVNASIIQSLDICARASARMRLSNTVNVDDVEIVTQILSPFEMSDRVGDESLPLS
jgi:DNA replicative helicase MCM subunit Mcm2 (Cdc46/Mcm family)